MPLPDVVMILPDRTSLRASRPEHFVLAYAVASACGLAHPTQPLLSWVSGVVEEYNGSWAYWCPYGFIKDRVYVQAWARGAYAYLARGLDVMPIAAIDPSAWYSSKPMVIRAGMDEDDGCLVPESVSVMFRIAQSETSVAGPVADSVIDVWTRVRSAQQKGTLLASPAAIRRALNKAKPKLTPAPD